MSSISDPNVPLRERLRFKAKLLRFDWFLLFLICLIASVGFFVLHSVGSQNNLAAKQIVRFLIGLSVMCSIALINVRWIIRTIPFFYVFCLLLLLLVEIIGKTGMGAQRWLDIGFFMLQPSELMKLALVLGLAYYYHILPPEKISRPLWVFVPLVLTAIPTVLVLKQPDLGTSILLMIPAFTMMFVAGVRWRWFISFGVLACLLIGAVLYSQGKNWQILKDYQYKRIHAFVDPSIDPLGSGYHVTQSKIAFGSGEITGMGYKQGTQSHLNFLPENHTDFIFTVLAEEFGLIGSISLLLLYVSVLCICFMLGLNVRYTFGRLLVSGTTTMFFLLFAVNMAMVMGLIPVVGVPLPLVSYGGTSMMVVLLGFGLIMNVRIHRTLD
jgi:rod shape determining protein RodA